MSLMGAQLERNVKDVIAEFPAVERILDAHGIGCGSCAVGTCLLGSIIEVHGLSVEEERKLMAEISAALFPGRAVEVPLLPRSGAGNGKRPAGSSPPVRILVDEHKVIKRLLAIVPWVAGELVAGREAGFRAATDAVAFIRGYADRFHHAKEEDVLFAFFDPGMEMLAAMRAEHDKGRAHVRETVAAVEARDGARAAESLTAYRVLLAEHIRKEDGILYPFLDGKLTTGQVGAMYARFAEIEREFGDGPRVLADSVSLLEKEAAAPQ